MVEVKAAKHTIYYTDAELREIEDDIALKYPVRIFPRNPRGTGDYGPELLDHAARALYLNQPAMAKRFYSVALQCIAAGARGAAAGIGVEVDFEVDGKAYRGPANQPCDVSHPVKYVRALTFAIALRTPVVADELMAVPAEELKKAAGGMDEAYLRYAAAWRSFWQNAPDTPSLLEEAAELFDPKMLRVADPKSAARHSANIPVMQALLENDAGKLNVELVNALKAHKAWWGRGSRLNDPEGLIANQPAALASLALQRGMTVTVKSDYMPRWLIEGRDPE